MAVLLTHSTSYSRRSSPAGDAMSSQTSAGPPALRASSGGTLARTRTRKLPGGDCGTAHAECQAYSECVPRMGDWLPKETNCSDCPVLIIDTQTESLFREPALCAYSGGG